MSEFSLWFSTGLEHILDIHGYDHILYVMVLCVLYSYREWKNLLVLVTAFTIGHSITLACSVLGFIAIPQHIIEILIPLTILTTCIFNILKRDATVSKFSFNYVLALFFGFIHGLGFSYLMRAMLDKEESVVMPLLSFNLGLEAGQLIIVTVMLVVTGLLYSYFHLKKPLFITILSSMVGLVACYLLFNRISEI